MDNVVGIRTQGRRIVGAVESIVLWRFNELAIGTKLDRVIV